MKYTLLELVQDVLSSMDSDEVTSINDTVEAQQVAKVVRTAYFDIVNASHLPEHFGVFNLDEASADFPVFMLKPEDLSEIKWIKYDHATVANPEVNMRDVKFLPLKDFLDMQDRLDPTASWVESANVAELSADPTDDLTIYFTNNASPQYYTIAGDFIIVFDSYDSAVETFLHREKSRAYGRLFFAFPMEDGFVPYLDEPQFQLLLNESKSLAWQELKQSPHAKAEQGARRGWIQLQRSKHNFKELSDFENLPNFGRKSGFK